MESCEIPLTVEKELIDNEENELFKCIEYELQLNHEKCILIMKINPDDKILFQTKYKNNVFSKEYTYDELIKVLLLIKDYYNNIKKIFKFLDTSFTKKRIRLLDDKDEKIIKLKLKKQLDYDEVNCFLYLKLCKDPKEKSDKFIDNNIDYKILYESIKKENEEIKANIELIKKDNEEMKKNIELLKKEYKEIKNLLSKKENEKSKNKIEILKKDDEKMTNKDILLLNKTENPKDYYENEENENKNKEFNELKKYSMPMKFKFVENIIKNEGIGDIENVFPFNKIKESAQYLIISKKEKYSDIYIHKIFIMMMANNDNTIIKKINTNFTKIYDIKYHSNSDKKEYLYISGEYLFKEGYFSNQYNLRVIAFDIQNDYNENIIIDINDYVNSKSILLLFDVLQKNYILISYYKDKFSKLYDYQKNDSFINNIHGTNNYETILMIPWTYKDKWYIIDICYDKIYINNLLEDESFAELKMRGVENYLNGFLYKDKFLYVYNGQYESNIIIWDLINKNVIKNIEVKDGIKDMLLWDNNYAILLTSQYLYAFDVKTQKIINQLIDEKGNYYSVKIKKIKLNDLGKECLILHEWDRLALYERE